MLRTRNADMGATHSPEGDASSTSAPLHDFGASGLRGFGASGLDHTVQIATVGSGSGAVRPPVNSQLLRAIGPVPIQQDRAESLLAIISGKRAGALLSRTGADLRPLFINHSNRTEAISA